MSLLRTVAVHSAAWIIYTVVAASVYGAQVGFSNAIVETSLSYTFSAGVFYANLYLLNWSFGRKKYWLHVPILIGISAANFVLKASFFKLLFPPMFGYETSIQHTENFQLFLIFFWQSSTFLIFSTGYWFARQQLKNQKAAWKKDMATAEFEKSELENAALRAQINPHFLINTLGHFRDATAGSNPEVSDDITALMTFMQSSLPVTDSSGKIPLGEELDAIESLIQIFQMRYPDADIWYERDVDEDIRIVPHMLAPFIENAFKHGHFTDPGCQLRISVRTKNEDLYFEVFNVKSKKIKEWSRGIGQQYIKHQLERSYQGQYDLSIIDTKFNYTVSLTLQNVVSHQKNELLIVEETT